MSINLDLIMVPGEPLEAAGKTVIVIDVLRATSTIVAALANGCRSVGIAGGIAEALQKKQAEPEIILGGEQGGLKPAGFDLGNSPLEYAARIKGRNVLLKTTNGTEAVLRAKDAAIIIAAAFINLNSVAEYVAQHNHDTVLLCAGDQGRFSAEDTLCASFLAKEIQCRIPAVMMTDPAGWALAAMAMLQEQQDIENEETRIKWMASTRHGQRLLALGLGRDIRYCAQINRTDFVPRFRDGKFQ